jgi:hypothetical protein
LIVFELLLVNEYSIIHRFVFDRDYLMRENLVKDKSTDNEIQ